LIVCVLVACDRGVVVD